jgi:protocatechuate 3,4-dioxygenase beta subunit
MRLKGNNNMSAQQTVIERVVELRPTPAQVQGPFFLPDAPFATSAITPGDTGDIIRLRGQVLSTNGQPIRDAIAHFWLADTKGAYDNQDAAGNVIFLPRKKYRNRIRVKTTRLGAFNFECLRPGNYPLIGEEVDVRPGHIHARIEAPGFKMLVTQLYFQDDFYNAHDIPRNAELFFQPELVVHLSPALPQANKIQRGVFNFVLERAV